MSMSRVTGTSSTRPTPAASSSRFPPGTALVERIAPYVRSPQHPRPNSVVARIACFYVDTPGVTTGLARRVSVGRDELGWARANRDTRWRW